MVFQMSSLTSPEKTTVVKDEQGSKMKRVLTFDLLRGIAIIGVVLFHVLNIAFSDKVDTIEAALEGGATVELYWYILAPILLVIGGFNGLFLMISAASNAISVRKQWDRALEKEKSEKQAFKDILASQTIRGVLIWVFGFISESIIANGLSRWIESLTGETVKNFWIEMIDGFYMWNILNTIGLCLIITSLIQLIYLRHKIDRKAISVILIIVTIACTMILPLTREIVFETLGTDTFSNNWNTIPIDQQILRLILVPFVGRLTPLIPFFSSASAGLLISININDKSVTPGFLRKVLYSGLIFLAASFIVGIIFGIELGDRERNIFYQMFTLGLEIIVIVYLLYMVDFRKKTRTKTFVKYTAWIRRFGIMTLTLWMLQYFMIFPVILIEAITGWPIIEGGLNDPQLGIVLLLLFLMWHTILWVWEKANFKGSFEWLTSLVLSGGRSSGDRKRIDDLLYHSESMVDHVPERMIDPKEKALVIINIIFGALYALIIVLVALGVLSL